MPDKPIVSLIKCPDYDYSQVEQAVRQAVDSVGGIAKFVAPGQRVLLKINLLMKKQPDEAVTTHPSVLEAMVRLVQGAGGIPVIADSPGGPFSVRALKSVYTAAGIVDVAERTGAELNWDVGEVTVPCPDGKVAKSLTITNFCHQADVVISLAKLKTHGMTTMTGAVKVLFGVIPGLNKAEYHLKMPNVENFAEMLVDIAELVKPKLSIMDAIVGMEGDGPSAGTPRKIGAILASENSYALDVVAAAIIGLKPEQVPTIVAARKRGLTSALEELETVGCTWEELYIKDYKVPHGFPLNFLDGKVPPFIKNAAINRLRPKPLFVHAKCLGCGDCVRSCPPEALVLDANKRPVVDLDKCIRCFCCQELCPHKAVEIKRPWLGRRLWG
ncbi:MAG: DUF362 domain-containing protein [Peptococcaceae bacterium]|nr:DUF362 domain-containing protein [Peptococcaceae bacterium]